jgi:hypothetical protein
VQFRYLKEIKALEETPVLVRTLGDLARVKGLCTTTIDILADVLNGTKPIEVDEPAPAELARAANRPVPQAHIPGHGTGAYAILHVLSDRRVWHKDDIIRTAERRALSNSSFRATVNTGWKSAWNGMEGLVDGGLVRYEKLHTKQMGKKDEWQITDSGLDVVAKMNEAYGPPDGAAPGPGPANPAPRPLGGSKKRIRGISDWDEDGDDGFGSPPRAKKMSTGDPLSPNFGRQSYGLAVGFEQKLSHGSPPPSRTAVADSWAKRQELLKPAQQPTQIDKGKGPASEPCPLCSTTFSNAEMLASHAATCEGGPVELDPCPTCQKRFWSLEELERHADGCAGLRWGMTEDHEGIDAVPAARAPKAKGPPRPRKPATAVQPQHRGQLVGPLTISAVVDDRERQKNAFLQGIFNSISGVLSNIPRDQIPPETTLAADYVNIPICDYLFLRTDGENSAADARLSRVLPLGIERKTLTDLAGRSHFRDHIRQIAKMNRPDISNTLKRQFWLIEGLHLNMLRNSEVYRHNGEDLERGEKIDSPEEFFAFVCEMMLFPGLKTKVINLIDLGWTARFTACCARYLAETCRQAGDMEPVFESFAKTARKRKDVPEGPDLDAVGRLAVDTRVEDLSRVFEIRNETSDGTVGRVFTTRRGRRVRLVWVKAHEFLAGIIKRAGSGLDSFEAVSRACFGWLDAVLKAPASLVADGELRILVLEGMDHRIQQHATQRNAGALVGNPLDLLFASVLTITAKDEWHVQLARSGPTATLFVETLAWFLDGSSPVPRTGLERYARDGLSGSQVLANDAAERGGSVRDANSGIWPAEMPLAPAGPQPRTPKASSKPSTPVYVIEDSQEAEESVIEIEDSQPEIVISSTRANPAPRKSITVDLTLD